MGLLTILPPYQYFHYPQNIIFASMRLGNFTQCRKSSRFIQGLIFLYLMINVHAKNEH